MNQAGPAVLLVLLTGCATTPGMGGSGPLSSSGGQPTAKKELPWLSVPGGRMKTTLFYGPWQCRQEFMNGCRKKCASEGSTLMGCIWLADFKFDWEGSLLFLPVPVKAGSRYGVHHCCCNYSTLAKAENDAARQEWKNAMKSFRGAWSQRFGEWPSSDGVSWPGHHIRDLWHGGNPVDPNNVFPAQPGVHDLYNRAYPACYVGQPPWNTVGPALPYTDN
jgi:hypothetical protein